jgi:hypothetical protein
MTLISHQRALYFSSLPGLESSLYKPAEKAIFPFFPSRRKILLCIYPTKRKDHHSLQPLMDVEMELIFKQDVTALSLCHTLQHTVKVRGKS